MRPNEWSPVVSYSELANASMSDTTSSKLVNEISLRFGSDIPTPSFTGQADNESSSYDID